MKKTLIFQVSLFLIISSLLISGCKKDPTPPVLSTTDVSEITYTTAKSGGSITSNGGAPITARGICWSTTQNPTTAGIHTTDGAGSGSFESNLTDLTAGTIYYVRAYATNSAGTAYGNQVSFTTTELAVATLTTTEVTEITLTTAISGGDVTNDGGAPVTARGICWNTLENPTVDNSKTADGDGTGSYVSTMTELTPGTTYYVRAYATNSVGTAYGNQVSFTTTAILIPTLTTSDISEVTTTTAKSGGNITSDGGGEVTARGVCWSTSENPTTENSITVDGSGTGLFESSMTELTAGTTYYVRAYATNVAGTAYGNQVSFTTIAVVVPELTTTVVSGITNTTAQSGGNISIDGGSPVTARGVAWSTTENPTTANDTTLNGSGTGGFVSQLTELTPGTTYYVRAYATNSAGTAYGNQVSFTTTAIVIPTLTTAAVTAITSETATSGGNITANGGSPVTARGVVWNTTENPTITNSSTSNGTGTGSFVSNLTGLAAGTTYYVRAYATNSAGTAYGNQVSFTTAVIPGVPVLATTQFSEITPTSVVTGGTISNNGGSAIVANGVCWSTSENPTIADNITTNALGSATFVSSITGLTPGTVYYVRAYASNSSETGYGNQLILTTSISDIEGNVYRTVLIGTQLWTAVNLKTSKLNDNTDIPNVTGNAEWIAQTTMAYSIYSNNAANKDTYGALYNWHTVNTGLLCPAGWHVPTDVEYNTMEMYLGIPAADINVYGFRGSDQGTQLKGTTTWDAGGNGTNSSGFNALARGYRQWTTGQFWGSGVNTYFWTSTDDASNGNPTVAWYRRLDNTDTRSYKATTEKTGGKYVRCIKD
jgi:uncharacterized protein (TIGR02145 family)